MNENSDTSDSATEQKLPARERRWPDRERRISVEKYPGGDLIIELGHIDNAEDLYLQSGEAEALREMLNVLPDDGGESDE